MSSLSQCVLYHSHLICHQRSKLNSEMSVPSPGTPFCKYILPEPQIRILCSLDLPSNVLLMTIFLEQTYNSFVFNFSSSVPTSNDSYLSTGKSPITTAVLKFLLKLGPKLHCPQGVSNLEVKMKC